MAGYGWQISFRGTVSVQAGLGAGVAWYLLGRQRAGWANPVLFMFSPGVSAELSAVPWTIGPYSMFNAETNDPTDFSCWGAMTFARGVFATGGSVHLLNFYSVDHAPNPIPVAGVEFGLGFGLGWIPGRYKVLEDVIISTAGEGQWTPLDALNDSSDLSDAVADATQDYAANNTDPVWA